ncbi:polysaccharide deacetylase family protein [Pelovirga terrestris]|uniref:Polysaccharide deacetylase family protein n=1 Tax=Pelovirga terrestris TaxID=2771352 RepID=A0A8J6QPD6_9BACT|nr:polysaccharide deacetylase family protein [Pelovirga terrestris]MBD1399355.1 polysaccharide deacetylase family protein [Pelovirga terrestris]
MLPDTDFWESYANGNQVEIIKREVNDYSIFQSVRNTRQDVCDESGFATSQDIVLSSFWLLSRFEEYTSTEELDQHERFKYTNSLLYEDLGKSLVHLYAKQLALWIKEQYGISIPLRSEGMEAVISHDIDVPYYFGKARSVLSGAKARLNSEGVGSCADHLLSYVKVRSGLEKDRYATFDYIMQTQAQRGIKSTWFILLSDNLWGLDHKKYAKQLQGIAAAGHEIGLHPGYDSYLNPEKRSAEKKAIEQLSGSLITGARSHFLRFKIPESYRVSYDTGLTYDSTLGFAEREGFRAGFCSPFKPFDLQQRQTVDMLEIPMAIMDGTFRDYQHLQPAEAEVRIKAMIDHVADIHGTIVFNWHNTFLLAEEPGWRNVYENSLDYLIEKNAVFSTANDLARKWSERW